MVALRDLQQQYGIRFKKGLGQNLLLDDNINRIMVDAAALQEEDWVIEVGPGLGALTSRLVEQAGRLFAVEIDASFMPCLEDRFGAMDHVTLFRGDILNHELERLVEEFLPGARSLKMVSNLPYYITTPLLFHFWESSLFFKRLVVMVQEEVGQRMVAPVGASNYGILSLAARYYADVDIVHKVPNSCFRPKPKVDSCIIRLRSRENASDTTADRKFLFSLIRAAFGQRRKTLKNTLTKSGNFGVPGELVLHALDVCGIDPGRRAQTLVLEDFKAIAAELRRNM